MTTETSTPAVAIAHPRVRVRAIIAIAGGSVLLYRLAKS
jgi:hypothetical protein